MTFATKVKSEISHNKGLIGRNKKAFSYGMMLCGKSFSQQSISMTTENKYIAKLYAKLIFQQQDGLITALPLGLRRIDALRTLTTEALAVLMPFKAQELNHTNGIYYGQNAVSGNMIRIDRAQLLNGHSFRLGVSGSGKSMSAKEELVEIALRTRDDILVLDPESEFGQLVKALGGEVRFSSRLSDLIIKDGALHAVRVSSAEGEYELGCEALILACGHSARDTYEWLCALGLPMQQKPFAIGARIEHLQRDIDRAQYGPSAGHPALPPAEYKLNAPTPDGRGVYTFCMCPGGQVINASSEPGGVNVNGMSRHARDGRNANAAVLVGVRPEDFGGDHPLAGMYLQRRIEQAAFRCAGGGFRAPCQRVGDFLSGRASVTLGGVEPTYLPGVTPGDLRAFLPDFITDNLRLALPRLGQRLKGFDHPDALLTGPETRSSAPVRILRNPRRQSAFAGLYPLGEGAGYAGGIVSAAVDGLCAGMDID